jgi:hypothetical protein
MVDCLFANIQIHSDQPFARAKRNRLQESVNTPNKSLIGEANTPESDSNAVVLMDAARRNRTVIFITQGALCFASTAESKSRRTRSSAADAESRLPQIIRRLRQVPPIQRVTLRHIRNLHARNQTPLPLRLRHQGNVRPRTSQAA